MSWLAWLVWLLIIGWAQVATITQPQEPDTAVVDPPAAVGGARCEFARIEGAEGVSYRVTWNDAYWLAKVLRHEAGPRFVLDETSATAWTFIQGWYSRRRAGSTGISLATYLQGYASPCSRAWATGGAKYHPRITPRADRCRAEGWDDVPRIWKRYVSTLLQGGHPNRWPGYVHFLARGFEGAAGAHLVGPFYATTEEQHPGGNAYYQKEDTAGWTAHTVRIVPGCRELRP